MGVPIAALFNARAESGQNYRIDWSAPRIPWVKTGTLYFDVVGDTPNSVVYNDGVQDLMVCGLNERCNTREWRPEAPGESTEIIGGAPAEGGGPAEGAPAGATGRPRGHRAAPLPAHRTGGG